MATILSHVIMLMLFSCRSVAQPPPSGSPVHVDMDKLTDFTTHFRMSTKILANNLQLPAGARERMPDAQIHGSIQADVGGERLKITLHGSGRAPNEVQPGEPPFLAGLREQGSAELLFDGPKGFVSYRAKETLSPRGIPPVKGEACVKVNFPQGLIPPPEMVKQQLSGVKPQITQMLNMMPHTDATVDGDEIAIYEEPAAHTPARAPKIMVYVGVKESDGTPLGAGMVAPADGKWEPFLKFTDWEHGAGEINEIQCAADLESTALAGDPQAMQVFDAVMANLKNAKSLQPVFAAFPSKPSLMFKTLRENAEPSRAQPTTSSFPLVAIAVACGALGGLVAFFAFAQTSSKTHRVSLISDDA